jgi:hypothetical protein
MAPRTRKRLVTWGLLALLVGGAVYALALHPGPDLRPQVEAFLRACDDDRVAEAMRGTGLMETWGQQELLETARFRRGTLGRFQEIESAEPLERLPGGSRPRRLLRVRLRFALTDQPLASTFTFTRGGSGWVLSDLDIPMPSGMAWPGQAERAKGDAEALARRLASREFQAAFEGFTRQTRRTTSLEAFEERMRPLLDGLGIAREVRCVACEAHGETTRARVEVRYDTGALRQIELELQTENGRWKATSVEVRTP